MGDGLGLLASAIAGRLLEVAGAAPGEPAWTDGAVVFVDTEAGRRDQVRAVAVQAALVGAGSLGSDVVARLRRRGPVARRYLAIEGHRALAVHEAVLPPSVRGLIDRAMAARTDSPAASLAIALSRVPIAEPPAAFGVLRPRRIGGGGTAEAASDETKHVPRRATEQQQLRELDDGEDAHGDSGFDMFNPIGGGGAVGRLLQRLLGTSRSRGGGQPGADAPTHRTQQAGTRSRGAAVSTARAALPADVDGLQARGTTYPEWNVHERRYRPDWCTVVELAPEASGTRLPAAPDAHALRRSLARLAVGLERRHRQLDGDDLDIDALVEARVDLAVAAAGGTGRPAAARLAGRSGGARGDDLDIDASGGARVDLAEAAGGGSADRRADGPLAGRSGAARGDDLDVDALGEARVNLAEAAGGGAGGRAGGPLERRQGTLGVGSGEAIYVDSVRRRRDLSVLILLDVSGSAGEPGAAGGGTGTSVHDHQVRAAAGLTTALHDLGDRVALYGFRSLGRHAVQVLPVKRFGDGLDATVLRRLGGLVPGAYTRLGAAIRHGASVLESGGGTSRRLLVVLSDGFAYDHGYDGAYGEADARRALAEARRRGTACLCLSVAAATDARALRRVFGTAAHASVPHAQQLAATVGPLFRAALQLAEVQRRTAQRRQRTRVRSEIERRTA